MKVSNYQRPEVVDPVLGNRKKHTKLVFDHAVKLQVQDIQLILEDNCI